MTPAPRTRWCTPSGRFEGPAPAPEAASAGPAARDRASAMLQGLDESLRRGYWKVALRRYLMMRASGLAVPAGLAERCRSRMENCPPAELLKIAQAVSAWSAFLHRRGFS